MSPQAGTILFQEHMIKVQGSSKVNDSPDGAHYSKLPLLNSPFQSSVRPRSGTRQVADYKPIKVAKAPEPLILPPIVDGTHFQSSEQPTQCVRAICAPSTPRVPNPRSARMLAEQNQWADVERHLTHSGHHGISGQTLAEIALAKTLAGGAVVCRNDERGMEISRMIAAREASRRRKATQMASAEQRARAHKKGEERKQAEQEQMARDKDDDEMDEVDGFHIGDEISSLRSASPEIASPQAPRWTIISPRGRSTVFSAKRPTILDPATEPEFIEILPPRSDMLRQIKLKSPKAKRMTELSKNRVRMKAEEQVRLRMEECKRQFESLPLCEQEALERAYRLGNASTASVAENANVQLLDHYHHATKVVAMQLGKLYNCLSELGLNGKKELEHKEIKLLCHEAEKRGDMDFYGFCFELVPSARAKLMELHQESLAEQFSQYDHDNNGFLDKDECSFMLAKLCRNMDRVGLEGVKQEFEKVFDRVKVVDAESDGQFSQYLDFEGFQVLYERVNEKYECLLQNRMYKIIEQHKLSSVEAKSYAEELLVLHDTFVQADRGGHSYLEGPEVRGALLEHGLMPYDATERKQVESMVECALKGSPNPGRLSFHGFLDLIRSLREVSRVNAHPRLLAYFQECDKDGNGKLSFAEACVIFSKLGMVPQCREDQDELKNMLLKVDVDNSGDLDFLEFTYLVQQVVEKRRTLERLRSNEIADNLGINETQVAELREIFFNLDTNGDGALGIEECRKALTLLHIDMPSEQLKSLFVSIDKSRSGILDLSSFFIFVEAISKVEPKVWIRLKSFLS